MEEKNRKVEEYLKDLSEIKKIIHQSEDNSVVEVWVYWMYGGLVIMASLLSYFFMLYRNFTMLNAFLMIWLPTIMIAILSEIVGWVRKMNKRSIPLLHSKVVKFGAAFLGQIMIFSILVYFLVREDIPHSGLYMLFGAMPIFLYSQITFSSIIIEAWTLTGMGIVFLLNNISTIKGSLFAGLIVGIVYLILGFHVRYKEKTQSE